MARSTRRQRDWMKAGAGLIVIAIIVGYWWHLKHPDEPKATGMTAGTVVETQSSDGQLELTVAYRVDGSRHETSGAVDAQRFRTDGKVVWVCYDPAEPGDTDATHLRLPTDPLCDQS